MDGIEFDDAAAAEARAWYRRMIVGDVEHTSLDLEPGSYDAIICADILEQLRHPEELLMRLRPLLAPGGVLLVSIPNISNWSMRLLHLMGGRWEYTDRGILDRTRVRFFYRRSFERLIHQSGYRTRALDVTVPLPLLRREPFNRLAHWFGLRCKNLLAYQFVTVAEPLE